MSRRRFLPLLVALAVLTTASPGAVGGGDAPASSDPHAVIAFVDTGINPYHEAFRAESPRAFQHPSTYLPGYPEDVEALHLTFNHGTVRDAVRADCEAWARMEPDTLYWVPGTRLVGVIPLPDPWHEYYGWDEPFTCASGDDLPPFMAGGRHGTMVASRGAGNGYGACESCLIVAAQGRGAEAMKWSADQPWIDVQSHAWTVQAIPWTEALTGPLAETAPAVTGDSPTLVKGAEDAAARQPAFMAAGNGLAGSFGVLGHPTQLRLHMTPSLIRVGAHDSGQVTLWHGSSPHVVSDGCRNWAAEHDSMNESTPRSGGGTSAATPFAAGLAAKLILEARAILGDPRTGVRDGVLAEGPAGLVPDGPLADGVFTMDELRRLLFATADPRPERIEEDGDVCDGTLFADGYLYPFAPLFLPTPVAWRDVPEGPQGIPIIGYGAVTPATIAHGKAVLRGEAPRPERPHEDAFFDADRAFREVTFAAYTSVPEREIMDRADTTAQSP